MHESLIVEALKPNQAFKLLANPTRLAFLQALWGDDDHEATFSELRRAIEMRDSGQSNYHLENLTGHFVTKTDTGYELRLAGVNLICSLLEDAYTKHGEIPRPLEESCSACDGSLIFRYEDERVTIDCEDYETETRFVVPPRVFPSTKPTSSQHSQSGTRGRSFDKQATDSVRTARVGVDQP